MKKLLVLSVILGLVSSGSMVFACPGSAKSGNQSSCVSPQGTCQCASGFCQGEGTPQKKVKKEKSPQKTLNTSNTSAVTQSPSH